MKIKYSLTKNAWLFFLLFFVAFIISQILVIALLVGVFKLPLDSQDTRLWINLLGWVFLLFLIVPYLLGFHERSRPFTAYLSEIRLTRIQPLLKLTILGVSCYLLMALLQVASTLIYRYSQGLGVNLAFIQRSFPITGEFPPRSWGILFSLPSIFEEIAFRGVILVLFTRFFSKPKAIFLSAISFGAYHLLGVIGGLDPTWAAGQAIWAAILGVFYGYITLKTGSLLPAILVHYLGNLFISSWLSSRSQVH